MRLRRLELPGFGCLRGFRTELTPGLNVFYGLNEAGKSTLQQAVCALLYGFYEHDRARADESRRHESFHPWDGGDFRGSLEYELDDGRCFEVRRDFSTPDVATQLIDAATGTDLSAQLGRGRHGNIPFARRHLGMSRGVFQSCAFISQGDVFSIADGGSPREIGDAIAAMADSARRDVSAANAIKRLDDALSKIGSDRARTAELPRARENLRQATAQMLALQEDRRAMAEKSSRLDVMQRRLHALGGQVLRAEFLLYRSDAAALRRRLEELTEAEGTISRSQETAARLASHGALPAELRDEMMTLGERRKRTNEALVTAREEQQKAGDEVGEPERTAYEELKLSVGGLTAEQIAALEEQAYRPAPRGLAPALGALLRAFAAGIAAILHLLRRRRRDAAPLAPAPPPAEALVRLERHRRYLTLLPAVERAQRLAADVERESQSLAVVEAQIAALLDGAGIEPQPDLAARVVAFQEAWKKRQECLTARAAAEEAKRRRDLLLGGRSREELETSLREDEAAAKALLAAHPELDGAESGASGAELTRSLGALRAEQHDLELQASRLAEELRITLERHRPRAELEEEIERWERRVRRLEKERAAAQLAKEAIEEAMVAVYRDFAPAVNAFLSEGMQAITAGRYHRAHVNPASLEISLLVPETDMVITNPPVSRGTWTVAYLLMRIGLAQHMSSIGESVPLVLDDPFVDVDSERLPRVLDFLLTLSRRMQILLFTKDEAIVRWFESYAADQAHSLHRLSERSLAAPSL